MSRGREAEDFALSRRGVLDEVLHLWLLAELTPLVITLKRVSGGSPDEVVTITGAEVGGHVAGAVPGAHREHEQISGVGEDGFFVLVQIGVVLARPMRRPEGNVA